MADQRAEKAREMLDVVDRAYASRIKEYVDYQVDLCRQMHPELFVDLDIAAFRREVERRLRADELTDIDNLTQYIEQHG